MNIEALTDNVVRKIMGARGQQVVRKDKDLMSDTGGTSKGRDREPHKKPPREESKKRYKEKRLDTNQKKEREKDDREVTKTNHRQSSIHPLDCTEQGAWPGLELPEQNYHRKVYGALWGILESERGVSEKDFVGQDKIKDMCERVIRSPKAEGMIQRCSNGGQRAVLCAEWIYEDAMGFTQMRD